MSDPASSSSVNDIGPSSSSTDAESKHARITKELPGSTDVEQFKKEITSSDCLLIIMGTLAAGKTTFIYELMDTDRPELIRSPELQNAPDTREVEYRCIEPAAFTKGNRLFVIDTPPIMGGQRSDTENLINLRDHWVAAAVKKKVSFVGLVFIQDLISHSLDFRFEDLPSCLAPCVEKKIPHQIVFASTRWSTYKEAYIKDMPKYSWTSMFDKPTPEAEKKAEAEEYAEKIYAHLEEKVWATVIKSKGAKMVKSTEIGTWEKQLVMDMVPEVKSNPKTGWLSKISSRLSGSK